MQRFNKSTAAIIAGAVVSVAGAIWASVDKETLAAAQTLVTAALVWLVPNVE